MHTRKNLPRTLAALLLLALPTLTHAGLPTSTEPVDTDPAAAQKEWDSTPLDATTPRGFLRIFCKTINEGDEKKLRSLLQANNPKIQPILDICPAALIIRQSLRKAAAVRFGDTDLDNSLKSARIYFFLDDIQQQCINAKLIQQPDGSWITNTVPLIKDPQGNYRINLDAIPADSYDQIFQLFTRMTSIDTKLATLLHDNPTLTLEKFTESATTIRDAVEAALTQPATAPATQQ